MRYVLAHDMGTSGDKASLVNEHGEIVDRVIQSYSLLHRQSGWAEQDPLQWWNAFCECNRKLLHQVSAEDVKALVLTGQMMCCLPLDFKGDVLYPAITWADTRAGEEAAWIEREIGEILYYETTGMRAAAGYVLPKLLWLKKNRPEIFHRTASVFSPKDYITWLLTGKKATDPETAVYTHAYDRKRKEWSKLLLDKVGVRQAIFPEVLEPGTRIGSVLPEISSEAGLPSGLSVVMGVGDGGAATLGTGICRSGDTYISLGTSAWVCMMAEGEGIDTGRRVSTINYLDHSRISGTMQTGGKALHWLKQLLSETGQTEYTEMSRMAQKTAPGSDGMLFLPYLAGERSPYWDEKLRGAFIGMTLQTSAGQMIRSVMEGVAFHLRMILEILCEVNGCDRPEHIRLVGGGGAGNAWGEVLANVLKTQIEIPENADYAGTEGISVIAFASLGILPDMKEGLKKNAQIVVIEPDETLSEMYDKLFGIFKDAAVALHEINHRLQTVSIKTDKEHI